MSKTVPTPEQSYQEKITRAEDLILAPAHVIQNYIDDPKNPEEARDILRRLITFTVSADKARNELWALKSQPR